VTPFSSKIYKDEELSTWELGKLHLQRELYKTSLYMFLKYGAPDIYRMICGESILGGSVRAGLNHHSIGTVFEALLYLSSLESQKNAKRATKYLME